MNPICTVLLITYNHIDYIKKAIDSVLSQRTKYDYIIYIFDDASTDGSSEIIREYEKKYPLKIKAFISEQNLGAQANIWRAYQSVNTKYSAFLETDDYWCDDEKLELQITALEQHPDCSFCSSQSKIVNINDDYRKNEDGWLLVDNKTVLENSIVSLDMILKEYSGYITQLGTRVIRMSHIQLDEIKYKEAFLFDNCQFFYMLLKGNMYFINRVMFVYQQTGTGVFSGNHPLIRADNYIQALLDFNRETNNIIAEKIYREIVFYLSYTFRLLTPATGEYKSVRKNFLSRLWTFIYKKPINKLRKK